MDSINNSGIITGSTAAIFITTNGANYTGSIKSLTNNGTVNGGTAGSIDNEGTITALTNAVEGTINGAVDIGSDGVIKNFTNNGTIDGSKLDEFGFTAIFNTGTITTLTNEGTINGDITSTNATLGLLANRGDVIGSVKLTSIGSSPTVLNNTGASIRSAATSASVVQVISSPFAVLSNAGIIAARLSDEDDYAEGSVGVTFVGEDLTLNNREGGEIGGVTGLRIGNDDGDTTTVKVTNTGTIDGGTGIYVNEGVTIASLDNKANGKVTVQTVRFVCSAAKRGVCRRIRPKHLCAHHGSALAGCSRCHTGHR